MNMYMVKATALYEWWLFLCSNLSVLLKDYPKYKMNYKIYFENKILHQLINTR